MSLGKYRNRINSRAKAYSLKLYELASGGAVTAMSDIGYIESAELVDEPSLVESVDAAGDLVNSIVGSQKATLKVVLKQTSYDEINLVNTAGDKPFHVYLQVKLDDPTTTFQELYIPLAKITSPLTLSYAAGTERKIEITFTMLMPKGTVTVTPAGLSVAAGKYYALVDTAATALGAPTTANGTVYTAAY